AAFTDTAPVRIRALARVRLSCGNAPAMKASRRDPSAAAGTAICLTSSASGSASLLMAAQSSVPRPCLLRQTKMNADDLDEAPLDAAQLRLQARLKRLILISGLTLGIGIFAVLAAVIYRIYAPPVAAPPAPAALIRATAKILPAGARLTATSSDGYRIVLTYEHAGGTTLVTVDPRSLAVTGRLDLKPE